MKNKILIFVITILVLTSTSAYTLHTPAVSTNSGVITLMLTNNTIALGGELGLTPNLAVAANLNAPFSRIGVKYQIDSNLALLGGVSSGSTPYLGVNGSNWINRDLTALYELNLLMSNNKLILPYELGIRINLNHNLDLRAGVFGNIESDIKFPSLKAGIGYRF